MLSRNVVFVVAWIFISVSPAFAAYSSALRMACDDVRTRCDSDYAGNPDWSTHVNAEGPDGVEVPPLTKPLESSGFRQLVV
jgi:hypothetical protein